MPQHYPFQKQPLPYYCYALLPHLDPDTVYLHHHNIYGNYVDSLNALIARHSAFAGWSLERLITDDLPVPVVEKARIKESAGAIYAHELYFASMCPPETQPYGKLAEAIAARYGSIRKFKDLFIEAGTGLIGSGWVWLNSERDGNVHIALTSNHQAPQLDVLTPVLALDMWEHAYYLKYPAQPGAYMENWFDTADWNLAEQRFLRSLAPKGPDG